MSERKYALLGCPDRGWLSTSMARASLLSFFVVAFFFWAGCADPDGDGAGGGADASSIDGKAGDAESVAPLLTMDVTYPAGAVGSGQRPTISVYLKSSYSDLSKLPTVIPVAAILGNEGEEEIKGKMLDLAQKKEFLFESGASYVVVASVALLKGMPKPIPGTPWVAKPVTFDGPQKVTILADDSGWKK